MSATCTPVSSMQFWTATGWPRDRRLRPRTSPSTAVRRWPMCVALLGLMLVCSTMTLPGGFAWGSTGSDRKAAANPERRGKTFRYPAHSTRRSATSGGSDHRRASSSAIARGFLCKARARGNGAGKARSPSACRERDFGDRLVVETERFPNPDGERGGHAIPECGARGSLAKKRARRSDERHLTGYT